MTVPTSDPVAGPAQPDVTSAQVIAKAEAIAPMLVERQAETEERTHYPEDVHEEFRKAGFYRILVPRRYGGHELGIDTFMRVVLTLTRACPSTGWMYCLGHAHAHAVATLFEERAQDELFAGGDFICPATVVPSGTAERADGGWVLNGVWSYCSGAPYATHFMGHTLVPSPNGEPPRPLLFVAPRSTWERLDDWGASLGLKGSGSHSIAISGGFVPDRFTLDGHLSRLTVTAGTPGVELHGNPEYGGGPFSVMILEDAVLALGMAQGALDAYEELMSARTAPFSEGAPRTEDPDYQLWYGEAAAMIATGEAAFFNVVQQWRDACAEGPAAFTQERELRMALICREVVELCWRAVEGRLFPTAGSSSVRRGQRIERVWRDLSMLHSHAGVAVFLSTIAKREYTKARFGVG
ncbi:acyl-CoA dehydrogenase family protein [Thermomonospora cellulosilytica]|uniref:3-hydroxy-9,10-secoandrosta-1,3,5(10)-triene-9, 17-dione monooxygenase n=1 Tax=Thermomonospora cellulosilytica TaxID=1411118 RepID=A0A7W3RC55_9ACTN|nr:acyl-CoA dehydrogenase family protein [Thermomonospora cellulosilytica]MBA9007757.1 3-hydroxy-9,10-secoandrosta-1,3,5(10)-triene-9,17-dione monooxygenase [Thermomonospora cellulosilytica]